MNHTRRRQRRGTRDPERKVSLTRPNLQPTKGRMESIKPQGGSMNAKRSQEDHPAIQDEGTEKGKQLGETRHEQSNNGKAQAHRRVASTGDGKKPLRPHNQIPTVEEKPARTEEQPWLREVRSRHSNNTKKATVNKQRKTGHSPVLQGDRSHNRRVVTHHGHTKTVTAVGKEGKSKTKPANREARCGTTARATKTPQIRERTRRR